MLHTKKKKDAAMEATPGPSYRQCGLCVCHKISCKGIFSLSFCFSFVCFNGFAYFLKSYITVKFRHHNCVMLVISEVPNIL